MSSEKTVHEVAAATDTSKFDSAGSVLDVNEKALVRRIDYRIVPLMFLCYLMQFLDKVLINVGSSIYSLSGLTTNSLGTVCQRNGLGQKRQIER